MTSEHGMNETEAIIQAAQEIAAILAQVEKRTGRLVSALALTEIDVTDADSPVPIMLMSVRIELERPRPQRDWSSL